MINKETYFDFIEKKLNRITRGQDLTFGELDECFYKLNSLKKDYLLASGLGFKCFYVKHKDTKIDKKLFINCPASIEMGQKTSCSLCSLCSGSKRDVVINAHGSTSKYVLVEA